MPAAQPVERGTKGQELCPCGVTSSVGFVSNWWIRRKLPDPSSCRVKRCPSCSGGREALAPHPTPWGLPPQSPCRASADAVRLAISQWSRCCQVLGFIPGSDERESRSPSLVPRAAPIPQGERLLPSPRCR